MNRSEGTGGFLWKTMRFGACLVLTVSLTACNPHLEPGSSLAGGTNQVARSGAAIAESCLLCHSTREMQRGPILDGLPQWYGELQLKKFMEGIRGGNLDNKSEALMGAGIAALQGAREAAAVAEYFSRLPARNHLRTARGDAEKGRQLYQACVGCHGASGQGNPLVKGPPLNVQEDWYLLDQMRKFKSGARGAHPWDVEGQMMRVSVQGMEDKDFRDVIIHVAGLGVGTNGTGGLP